ncbi:MAG: hypothetical protein ACRET7_00295 [Burkholderiales bacterium]
MSEQGREAIAPARAIELLSIGRFQEELRRVTRFRLHPPVGDPLNATVRKIEKNPAFAQSRLLTRLLAALTYERGEFRRAEVAAFDSETLSMVIALMDAHAAGTSTREEWICAVDLANAAHLGAGG